MEPDFSEICQDVLPLAAWTEPRTARLPGVNPLKPADWLCKDEAFAAQMAYRDWLIAHKRQDVYQSAVLAREAAAELLELVVQSLDPHDGYLIKDRDVTRPDGVAVSLIADDPLITAARLVQEDFVVLQKPGDEHVMTGAVLCFPASWRLDEKFMRPLTEIHVPVVEYTKAMAQRVQRIFDGIRVERPVWRMNYLIYSDPDLHQPRSSKQPRTIRQTTRLWLRSERQCLRKLPNSQAMVFSIHSYVVPFEKLTKAQRSTLPADTRHLHVS